MSLSMTRVWLGLLQVVSLIGICLSVLGWVGVSVQRAVSLMDGSTRRFGRPMSSLDGLLFVLDGMKDAAVPLFLSGILFAVCEIALRLVPRTTPRDAH